MPASRVLDPLLEFDPGYFRLRTALRGTAAVAAVYFLSNWLVQEMHGASSLPYLGVLVSMLSSMFVLEPSLREQKRTMLHIAAPAIGSVLLGIAFAPWEYVRLAGFMIYVFTIVFVRPLGARWTAVGTVGFMSYFCALFFALHAADIAPALAVIALAVLLTYASRFWVFPDRVDQVLRWTYRSFQLRLKRARQRLSHAQLQRLTHAGLHFENVLRHNLEDAPEDAPVLLARLFDMELAARHQLERGARESGAAAERLRIFRSQLGEAEEVSVPPGGGTGRYAAAVQATLATGLATLLGLLVSPQRWYWASFAAFFTLTGAARSETLARAALRVLGTVAGLVCGILLAQVLHSKGAEGILIFTFVFLTIFTARMAYGFWSALLFTLLLALFYDFLGMMTDEILSLRLQETLVGAAIGAAVAFFIFPVSTRSTVRAARAGLLQSVRETLDELGGHHLTQKDLISRLHRVDQKLEDLRLAAGPFEGRLALGRDTEVPRLIHEASTMVHHLKQVAADVLACRTTPN